MWINQTQLGELFGGSSHDAGHWLDALGLRYSGRPTSRAFDGGYVTRDMHQNGGYYYLWDREKVVAALEAAGHKQVPQESTARISGPFTAVENGHNAFQILSGDGTVSVWVVGRENAVLVTKLLNLAHKYGRLGEEP